MVWSITGLPPSNNVDSQIKPIYSALVITSTLARFSGGSGTYAARIVTDPESVLKPITFLDLTMNL